MQYSNDLRARVIAAAETGEQTYSQVAATFHVSLPTVKNWMRRRRETGQSTALPWAGGKRRALAGCEACIRAEVRRKPDSTLAELCAHVAKEAHVVANLSMMSRELILLKLPVKKSRSTTANGTPRGSNGSGKPLRKSSTRS